MLAAAGYRVIVPYLRGYGTTRFLSSETPRNGQQAALAVDVIALMDALEDREGDHRRLRLGRADRQHRRRALAGALQGAGLRQRLSDRQPGGQQAAAAAEGRAAMVVPVLFRDRARPRRLRQIPARLRQADLADRLAAVEVRRRHVRPQRRGVRQSRPRRHRDPQLPLAARPGRGRSAIRRAREAAGRGAGRSPCRRSRWKATPTARRIRSRAPTPGSSPADTSTGPSRGGIGHNLPQEAPQAFAQAVIDVSRT